MIARYDRIEVLDGEPLNVIWASASLARAAIKPVDDAKAWPRVVSFEEISDMVEAGLWSVRPGHMPSPRNELFIPQKHRDKRDERWDIVSSLVLNHVPEIFDKKRRVELVAEASELHEVTTHTVKKLLLLAFHGGMVADAMLPAWDKIGRPGQPRPAKEGGPKRGRPRKDGRQKGKNTTLEMRKLFLLAGDWYDGDKRLDLPRAFRRMIGMFFSKEADALHVEHGKRIPLAAYEVDGLPRYETFAYYVRAERDREESMRRRIGERRYDMERRPLLDDSTGEAWGPGARYQIDATIVDVYVRSRRNRRRLIGRPTLYVVIDVFSRMIVGFSLSFDPPSWQAAMTALANAVTDKVAFCAKFGITITEDDWPCHHIPAILEGDRGEIEGSGITGVLKRFQIAVENAAAFRADWKGIVEQRFNLLQAEWGSYVDGYVAKDFGERGARDYRLDAVLDIDNLTRLLIRQILYFNNWHELKKYPRLPEMTEDQVPSVPRELWKWGVATKGGLPRTPREEVFLFALLPTAEASVTPQGIKYHGAFYSCERAVRENWFSKARDKRFKVTISYDKRDSDRIYVHDPKARYGFQVAELTRSSRRRAGSNGWEIEDLIRSDAALSADRRDEALLKRVEMERDNESDVAAAKERFDALGDQWPLKEQIAKMREARATEVKADRAEDAADYRERMGVSAPDRLDEPAGVMPLHRDAPKDGGSHEGGSQGSGQKSDGAQNDRSQFAAPSLRQMRSRIGKESRR